MAKRGLIGRIPIWVRVPGIIALVLVGIVISAMLLDTTGGGHGGSGDDNGTRDHGPSDRGGHGPGDRQRGGGHGSGDEPERSDHNQGLRGPDVPAGRDLAADSARVVTFAMPDIVFVPAEGAVHRGSRA